jgi:hypothetical protein
MRELHAYPAANMEFLKTGAETPDIRSSMNFVPYHRRR